MEKTPLMTSSLNDKKLKFNSTFEAIPSLLSSVFGIILCLPVFAVYTGYSSIRKLITNKKSKRDEPLNSAQTINFETFKNRNKEYDLILYGATGFTGKLAMAYLIKQYGVKPNNFIWAIAGRRGEALESLKQELCPNDSNLLDVLVADSSNLQALSDMVSKTKVVISTVGPYNKYGKLLVEACANLGVHYADISGETDFMRYCIDKYEDIAKLNKSKIIIHCGHDSIPWDIGVYQLSKTLKEKGDELKSIKCFDEINAFASGGTLATAVLAASSERYKSSLGYDPLLREGNGTNNKSNRNIKVKIQNRLAFKNDMNNKSVGPFFMAPVNANCIRRSNVLLGYTSSSELTYYECQVSYIYICTFIYYKYLSYLYLYSFILYYYIYTLLYYKICRYMVHG